MGAAGAVRVGGGNPATNTGNGFYGLYQFTASTWHAMGGSGLPSDASAAEQTMRAQKLQQQAGWGQWPGCAASLGLM
ncbi:transglycosylase family protein [Winkia neuii]|uniref:transglycosylase family protein n=1 Tax=Winkia neuii TaxID=33007 RepID=UPI00370383EF